VQSQPPMNNGACKCKRLHGTVTFICKIDLCDQTLNFKTKKERLSSDSRLACVTVSQTQIKTIQLCICRAYAKFFCIYYWRMFSPR